VRVDLSAEQWDAVDAGELRAPDGTAYHRRGTRMTRRKAADLVEAGSPVVVHWPGGGPPWDRVTWHDGEDATAVWAEVRPRVTSEVPDPRRGQALTAGRWESAAGDVLLVLTWHH
jgi:hypothetical protein